MCYMLEYGAYQADRVCGFAGWVSCIGHASQPHFKGDTCKLKCH